MIPWSPLGRGFLTRPFDAAPTARSKTDAQWTQRGLNNPSEATKLVNKRVEQVANKRGISMAQAALAWSLSKDFVTAPIVGTTKLESLRELIDGVNIKLTEDEIKLIDEAYEDRGVHGHT